MMRVLACHTRRFYTDEITKASSQHIWYKGATASTNTENTGPLPGENRNFYLHHPL